jgi:hypothetical protein
MTSDGFFGRDLPIKRLHPTAMLIGAAAGEPRTLDGS